MKNLVYIFIFAIVVFIAIGIYGELTKKSAKSTRLSCQKEVVFFENLHGTKSELKKVQSLLKQGKYRITSSIQKSVYMESKLFEKVSTDDVNLYLTDYLGHSTGDEVEIDYFIYENDKLDPKKKTEKSKLYAGYLNFQFKLNGKSIYQSQIDFWQLDGSDINKRIKCIIKAVLTF